MPLLRTARGFQLLGSKVLAATENLGAMMRLVMGDR